MEDLIESMNAFEDADKESAKEVENRIPNGKLSCGDPEYHEFLREERR